MPMLLLLIWGGLVTAAPARVDAERAVERARYAFVIGSTRPFDEVYPPSVFEKRVERELSEEAVLHGLFGLSPTIRNVAEEFDRIERTTRAPEQWAAIKQALGNDRRLIEEVFCRPLLVARVLRARFAFDPTIHAAAHEEARRARALLRAGREVPGAAVVRLRRRPAAPPSADELLREAKARAALRRVVPAMNGPLPEAPLSVDPEVAAVLEKELKQPGDVTTILEHGDRFEVLRLVDSTGDTWKAQVVSFPKVDFQSWFARSQRRVGARTSRVH